MEKENSFIVVSNLHQIGYLLQDLFTLATVKPRLNETELKNSVFIFKINDPANKIPAYFKVFTMNGLDNTQKLSLVTQSFGPFISRYALNEVMLDALVNHDTEHSGMKELHEKFKHLERELNFDGMEDKLTGDIFSKYARFHGLKTLHRLKNGK